MPPAVTDQPSRAVAKWPRVAVAAVSRSATRSPSNTIVVRIASSAAVTCHVGEPVPSHVSGSPVGPTGGESPQAWAVRARAATTAVAIRVATPRLRAAITSTG
jgi:hypothetical protein